MLLTAITLNTKVIETKIINTLSIEDYLDKIRPYLNDLINNHRTQGEWKIPLTMAIIFFLKILKKFVLCIILVIKQKFWFVIKQLKSLENFLILFYKDTKKFRTSNERKWIFYDSVDLLHHKFHRISLNRGGPYIDSRNWLKNRKAKINTKNNDNKCLQSAAALNYQI